MPILETYETALSSINANMLWVRCILQETLRNFKLIIFKNKMFVSHWKLRGLSVNKPFNHAELWTFDWVPARSLETRITKFYFSCKKGFNKKWIVMYLLPFRFAQEQTVLKGERNVTLKTPLQSRPNTMNNS